jgi:protein-disulfide isomerase
VTRFLSIFALSFLVFTPAQADKLSAAQKAEIKTLFEQYIMDNGEMIVDSVNLYQTEKEEKDRQAANVKAKSFMEKLEKDGNFPMAGNKKGDITIVEFFDFNCGYCGRALDALIEVLEKDKNIHVIFLDMPILGPQSMEASKWALAAHKQDKYFEFHRQLMNVRGPKNEAAVEKIAKNLELDMKQLRKDKDSKEIANWLNDNVEQASAMNVRGTPGFIIEGKMYPGYMPAERIFEILKEIRTERG